MKHVIKSSLAVVMLTVAAASFAHAANIPEIDPSMGAGGLTLLAGTMMVIRGLRKR